MTAIPGFQLESVLHDGLRTIVYRARRQSDGAPVVVKCLKSDDLTADDVARFRNEQEITRRIEADCVIHPSVFEAAGGRPYMVFEGFDGVPLAQLLTRPAELEDGLHLMLATLRAVGAIHQAGVVHKDLEPSNILVDRSMRAVRIIDFDIASRLSREQPELVDPHALEGALRYLSPERTGRMNRTVDYRTDFYTLGAVFYELLVGQPVFDSPDPMELVHYHIAKRPVVPDEARQRLPEAVIDIVLKLLAKTPEDRYQSTGGIIRDVERCLAELRSTGTVTRFQLGSEDASDRFVLAQRLYGRQDDLERLLRAFDTVATGDKRVVLVEGPSGIGKSALVREVHKPMVQRRGYFAAGKCEQLQRHLPYAAFTQALRDLVGQILTEGEPRIAGWRAAVRESLGSNARVVAEVVPELERLTGPLAAVPELDPEESQLRLNDAFRKLLRLVANAHHPLVLFLDDLQWIDGAGLSLIKILLADPGLTHLLFVGAFRGAEVGAAHPLTLTVEHIHNAGTKVETVSPSPLSEEHVGQLISDSLHGRHDDVEGLARLVHGRTDGNPFFVGQYLEHLHREGVIRFLHASGTWTWEPEKLAEMGVSDGVVELTRAKILKTSEATQQTLQIAACIGASFDLGMLAVVSGKGRQTLADELWAAMRDGIVALVGASYKLYEAPRAETEVAFRFVHDRVQNAAYELLSPAERNRIHLRIAHVLMESESADGGAGTHAAPDRLFDIVGHLNEAWDLIDDLAERRQGLVLNLQAGKRAKLNAAYDVALRCLRHAMAHLPDDGWERDYELAGEIHIERAECEYLRGNFDLAEQVLERALAHLKGRIERAAATAIRIPIWTNRGRPDEAIRLGLEALGMFGVEMDPCPTPEAVTAAIKGTRRQLESLSKAQLLALPAMVDREKLAIMRVINRLGPPAYFTDQGLYSVLHCLVIDLSLAHGHASESVRGYSVYGLILGSEFRAYEEGYRFGALAIQLADRMENVQMKGVSRVLFGCFISHWCRAADESVAHLQEAYRYLREAGNVVLASFALCFHAVTTWIRGEPVAGVAARAGEYLGYLREVKYQDMVPFMECLKQTAWAVAGATAGPTSFDDGDYREADALRSMQAGGIKTPLHWYYLAKMQLNFLFGDLAAAARMARLSAELLTSSRGSLYNSEHHFYSALITLARSDIRDSLTSDPRLDEARTLLAGWADQCPENFRHKHLLVEAECARAAGRHETAMECYDGALTAARDQRNLQMEALSAELAGRYYLERDRRIIAAAYLKQAHQAYGRWGASAKVADLQRRYGALLGSGPPPNRSDTNRRLRATMTQEVVANIGELDIGSIMKATRAIAEEIVLERLVKTFIRIVIESAGAESGHLIFVGAAGADAAGLVTPESLRVVARGHVEDGAAARAMDQPLAESDEVVPSIVHAVVQRQEPLVYDDAASDPSLRDDPAVQRRSPRSVLCFPVVQRGRLTSVLYLENNLAPGVFTTGRVEILRILAAQAAISIENAQLYAGMQEKLAELEEAQRQVADKERLKREMEIASRIQTSILPRTLQVRGLEIAATMRPATEVGGDYYDVIPTADGCWIGVGDVAGHGLPSGLVMVMIQSGIAALVRHSPVASPAAILRVLNDMIYDNVHSRLRQDEHATLVLIRYEADGRLTFAGAHEDIVICRADGRCEVVSTPGAWIGAVRRPPPQPETTCTLHRDDVMLLVTDGILEARNARKQEFGLERLCSELVRVRDRPVEAIRDHLLQMVDRWMARQDDDVTLMVARYQGPTS